MFDLSSPQNSLDQVVCVERHIGRELPGDYVAFLLQCDRFEGQYGLSYCVFYTSSEVIELNNNDWQEFYPGFVAVGSDGGLERYVINYNSSSIEYGFLPAIGDSEDYKKVSSHWPSVLDTEEN